MNPPEIFGNYPGSKVFHWDSLQKSMSSYPLAEQEKRIWAPDLEKIVRSIFLSCDMSARDSTLLSESLVAADLRGCHSHGVLRVPEYVAKLRDGGVDPRGKPLIVREYGGAAIVDANNSMGQIACSFAMDRAITKSRTNALAMVCIQGSNHCGALAHFARMASDQDMIGLVGTNALPTMAPYGGTDKILGINPLAVAIPAAKKHHLVFDAAFSASSHGKIRVYQQKNLSIPEGWAFDSKGRPTTSATEALNGLLQPIGGYKGTGLALIIGLLSTMLTEASYGTELGNMADGPRPGRDGHFCLAIDIAAFIEPSRFKKRIDGVITQIENGHPAPGNRKVYAPGGLDAEIKEDHLAHGIPLNQVSLGNLRATAASLGVAFDSASVS